MSPKPPQPKFVRRQPRAPTVAPPTSPHVLLLLVVLFLLNSVYAAHSEAYLSAGVALLLALVWLGQWVFPERQERILTLGVGCGSLVLAAAGLVITLNITTPQRPTSVALLPLTIPFVSSFWALSRQRDRRVGLALSLLYVLLISAICWRIWVIGYHELNPLPVLVLGLLYIYNDQAGTQSSSRNAAHQARREERERARFDPLTGLLGRQAFNEDFIEGAYGPPDLKLLILDIDRFKEVNDRYGHNIGDQVLAQVARLMREVMGERGRLYRWGGEEFVVLLPNSRMHETAQLAEQLRACVAGSTFGEVGHTSVSIGYGAVKVGQSRSLAFNRVDRALRDAKKNGRNRVEAA